MPYRAFFVDRGRGHPGVVPAAQLLGSKAPGHHGAQGAQVTWCLKRLNAQSPLTTHQQPIPNLHR